MKNKTAIYIPSMGRASRQFTVEKLAECTPYQIYVVVPKNEVREYALALQRYDQVDVMGCPRSGIGGTRQWILENTNYQRVLMFDDDMYFYHRKRPMDWHLATNSPQDNRKMLKKLAGYLKEGYVHAGMATRTEASFYLCESRVATRVNNVHAFSVPRLLKIMNMTGINFETLPVMEDFAVTLSLLTGGVPNKILLDYVWNQPGSNSGGGCSSYRTPEVQTRAANELHRLFPDFVKVVTKKVRGVTSWNGMKERTDVQIQWKKAYLASGEKEPKEWAVELKSKRRVG
jgi:hypothetical protein